MKSRIRSVFGVLLTCGAVAIVWANCPSPEFRTIKIKNGQCVPARLKNKKTGKIQNCYAKPSFTPNSYNQCTSTIKQNSCSLCTPETITIEVNATLYSDSKCTKEIGTYSTNQHPKGASFDPC